MKRTTIFVYGVACYFVFFATFLYAFGFLSNVFVPKSIDSGRTVPFAEALLTDVALLGIFAVQHSVMARRWFKRAWTKIVPEAAERSTYVLFSSLALILMFWQWQPLGGVIWDVREPALRAAVYAVGYSGWLLVLASTFLINHFDLFGLRQVYLYLRGIPYTPLRFRTPVFYAHVRHPLYLGWLLAFWAAPTMTSAHFLFAVTTTGYILMAIRWEEKDLLSLYGETYRLYRERIPTILPFRLGSGKQAPARSRTAQAPVS